MTAPSEGRLRPAAVCSVEGCAFAVTTDGGGWVAGLSGRGITCSDHPDAPIVEGVVDDREVWR